MPGRSRWLDVLGGEAGCLRLSRDFYSRIAKEPALRHLFPGKSLRCATEEFAAFLVQFLGGDERDTQKRWWLSLRESHARFAITPADRAAWLRHMSATLDAAPLEPEARDALREFFHLSASYVINKPAAQPADHELAERWQHQQLLDATTAALDAARDHEALANAPRFQDRRAVFAGLLARMLKYDRPALTAYVHQAIEADKALAHTRFSAKTLLHAAAAAGAPDIVKLLLAAGLDPNVKDDGGHPPLYAVANECGTPAGPEIVDILIQAGARIDAQTGVTQATALHMAARRGHNAIVRALLAHGANATLRDRKGDTAYTRALNCRHPETAALLKTR